EDSPDYACLQTALSLSSVAFSSTSTKEKRTTDLDARCPIRRYERGGKISRHIFCRSVSRPLLTDSHVVEKLAPPAGTGDLHLQAGAGLTLFFTHATDLLVAKRRQSVASSAASTASSAGGGRQAARQELYIDIRAPAVDPEDRRRLFAIECRLAACDDTDDEVDGASLSILFRTGRTLVFSAAVGGPNDEPFEVGRQQFHSKRSVYYRERARSRQVVNTSQCMRANRGRSDLLSESRSTLLLSHSDSGRADYFSSFVGCRDAAAPSAFYSAATGQAVPDHVADDRLEGNEAQKSPMMTVRSAGSFLMMRMLIWLTQLGRLEWRLIHWLKMWMCCRISSVKLQMGSSSLPRLNWALCGSSIAGGQEGLQLVLAADAPASAVSTSRLSRKKQLVSRAATWTAAPAALASLAVVGESNSTVRNPDDPYDMDDYEDATRDCEHFALATPSLTCGRSRRRGAAVPSGSTSPLRSRRQPQPLAGFQHPRGSGHSSKRIYFCRLRLLHNVFAKHFSSWSLFKARQTIYSNSLVGVAEGTFMWPTDELAQFLQGQPATGANYEHARVAPNREGGFGNSFTALGMKMVINKSG
uniref:IRS-type PTB domain-containing protein n=1 Tax=Macrostomum lignano TaxID=282301 RepID=A0A1I8FII1_9PLAT